MRTLRVYVIEFMRWVYWFPIRMFVQRIPLSWAYRLAWLISFPAAALLKPKAAIVDDGLRILLGDEVSAARRRTIVRKTFESTYKTAIEVLWYPQFTKDLSLKRFEFEGLEHLDRALEEKRGIVLLHAHMGNPHMLMPGLGHRGYKLNQMASRNPPQKLPGLLMAIPNWIRHRCYTLKMEYKEALPVHFFYTDASMKQVVKSLKGNGILAAAMDGREGSKSVNLPFLNRNAFFFTGVFKLIRLVEPIVLPAFVIRNDDDRQRVIIHPPMEFQRTEDENADIRTNTARFLSLLEHYVLQFPALYSDVYWLQEDFFLAETTNDPSREKGGTIHEPDTLNSTASR